LPGYLFVGLSIKEEKQMTIDESIARVKQLIQKREEIDACYQRREFHPKPVD
jgi:hypothetical protein